MYAITYNVEVERLTKVDAAAAVDTRQGAIRVEIWKWKQVSNTHSVIITDVCVGAGLVGSPLRIKAKTPFSTGSQIASRFGCHIIHQTDLLISDCPFL